MGSVVMHPTVAKILRCKCGTPTGSVVMHSTVPKILRYECGFSDPCCEVVCTKKLEKRDSDEEERQIG